MLHGYSFLSSRLDEGVVITTLKDGWCVVHINFGYSLL
jgi:hypothetical protein